MTKTSYRNLITLTVLSMPLLSACQEENAHTDSAPIASRAQEVANKHAEITPGKYQSSTGDLEITVTEGMTLFDLLVVSEAGRTGQVQGEITLKDNKGIYSNSSQDCEISFEFHGNSIDINQKGSCEMGLGVTSTGIYQSVAKRNASQVIGETGDELGSLFYAENEDTYRSYCYPGMEEESGSIVCRARLKSGSDNPNVVHLFHGDYNGPDGQLPPLDIAKKFKIYSTR